MTLADLRIVYEQIVEKQNTSDVLYDNYLYLKKHSNKHQRLRDMLELGISYYREQMYNEAYTTFSKAIELEADADAYHNRGTTCLELGNLKYAMHDFTAAIIFCPQYASPFLNRALCISQILSDNAALHDPNYSDIKEFAKNDFRKAIALGNEKARHYLGKIS